MVWPDVGAPRPVALLQPAALDRPVPGVLQPVVSPGVDERVVHRDGVLHRQVQLPSQLADVGDPQRAHGAAGDADHLLRAERERRVRQFSPGHLLQQCPGVRAHHREHRVGRGDVDQLGVGTRRDVARDPVEVVRREARAGGDVELVARDAAHREIALDAAALVEHLGVRERAHRLVDVVGADPAQCRQRAGTLERELGEGRLVDHGDGLADRPVLAPDGGEPVLAAVGVHVVWRLACRRRGEPVRSFPSELLAEARAGVTQARIQRREAGRAPALVLFVRPRHRVVLGVSLHRAGAHPVGLLMRAAEAAEIDGPQVVRRPTGVHPLGQRHAGAASGGDAEGVEPGTDEELRQLGRLAEDEVAVGREALGAIDQLVDTGGGKGRHAADRQFHRWGEVVEVGVKELEVEVGRDAAVGPRQRVRLVAAHHQPADLLLVVRETVGIAQRRQVARHAVDRCGDHVLVLHRHEGHVHADGRRQRARPLTGAAHDDFAGDASLRRHDSGDPARVVELDALDVGVLADRRPGIARAASEGLRDVGRVGLPVSGQERRAHDIVHRHEWPQLLGLARREQVHLQAERGRRRRLALHLVPPLLVAGEAQAAVHLPARRQPGLGLELLVQGDGVAEQLGDVRARAQLADEAGRMERGTRRELVPLDEHRVGPAEAGQVVGGGAPDDAAADDHRSRLAGLLGHGSPHSSRGRRLGPLSFGRAMAYHTDEGVPPTLVFCVGMVRWRATRPTSSRRSRCAAG